MLSDWALIHLKAMHLKKKMLIEIPVVNSKIFGESRYNRKEQHLNMIKNVQRTVQKITYK